MKKQTVLERSVVHAGEILIPAGEPHASAYIIQSGEIACMASVKGKKVEIGRFGPGHVVGECFLFSDEPRPFIYEAIVDTSVVVITRHDFTKSTKKIENTIQNVLKLMAAKIKKFEDMASMNAERTHDFDQEAMDIVQHLVRNLSDDKKVDYEDAMLPHFNRLVLVLRSVQERHRHEEQKRNVENLQARLRGDEPPVASQNSHVAASDSLDSFQEAIADEKQA